MCNTALQIVKILSRPVAIPFPQSNRCLARFEFKKINNERATNPAHLVVDKNTFFGYSSEYEASPRQVRVLADVRLLKILTWLGHREVGSAFHRETFTTAGGSALIVRTILKWLSRNAWRLAWLMFGSIQATLGGSPGSGGGSFFRSEREISADPPAGPKSFLSTNNDPAAMSKVARTVSDRIFQERDIAVNIKMVGTARFELATSRTPSVRATRLRYVPTGELTTTRQVSRGPNRGSNCNFKAITAVRAASRKCAAYRANRAASCGPEAAPRLRLRGSRPHSPHPNFLHARAESGAPPRW